MHQLLVVDSQLSKVPFLPTNAAKLKLRNILILAEIKAIFTSLKSFHLAACANCAFIKNNYAGQVASQERIQSKSK